MIARYKVMSKMLKTSLNLDTQCARDTLDPGYVTTRAHAHA